MWNEYGDTNLHVVFGDTQNDNWTSLNTIGWRTKFSPPLTYWLSIKSQLGSLYGKFGKGYVPFNIIIGPGRQVYLAETGFDDAASRNAIDAAIANAQFYPQNIIEDVKYVSNTEHVIDLSGVFFNPGGEPVVYSVETNSNQLIADTSINGSELTIITGNTTNTTELTVKGTSGECTAYFKFNVEVYTPGMTETFYESFESIWPPEGWTLKTTDLGWEQSSDVSNSGTLSAFHDRSIEPQNDWICSPKFLITENSVLSFWQRGYYTELYNSHGIAFSRDLNRFTSIFPNLPTSENWEQVFIDLSGYAGQEIYIGFNYVGKIDGSDKWFIDDVRIWDYTSGIEDASPPEDVKLFENYPNPFNPATELSFSINTGKTVRLAVYNSKGESVAEIFKGNLDAGVHKYNFDAGKLNSGIYFYALEFEGNSLVNKMLLLK